MPNQFSVDVPDVAQSLLGFQRARRLRQDSADREANRNIALERLGLLKSGQEQSQANAEANQAFRQTQAQRSQANADRTQDFRKTEADRNFDLAQRELDIKARAGSKANRKETAKRRELQRGGKQVIGAVDRLLTKVGSTDKEATKDQRAQADRFEGATGLAEGSELGIALNQLTGNIFGDSTLAKTVRQDAQAINTLMQRALLKGGGSITENERAQINQILGGITTAGSAREAKILLNNFKGLVNSIFDREEISGSEGDDPAQATATTSTGIKFRIK